MMDEGEEKLGVRVVRTADQSRRNSLREKRPKTSLNTGRITTANENLAIRLME